MPTVIDELIVTLGLDPSQFKKQADEANRQLEREKTAALKSGKLIEDQSRKQRQAFSAAKTEAMGFLSVLAGGAAMTAFVANTAKTDAAVGRLSTTLGLATEKIAKWQGVVRGVGGTNEDAIGALQTINQLGVDRVTGRLDPQRAGLLGVLGIAPSALGDPDAFGLAAAAAFQRGDPRIQADRMRRLGFGDPYINSLVDGPGALQTRMDAAQVNATVSARDADAAKNFERASSRVTSAARDRARQATTQALPLATRAMDAVAEYLERSPESLADYIMSGGPFGNRFVGAAPTPGAGQRPTIGTGRASFGRVVADLMAMGYTHAQARGMAAGISAETAGTFSPSIKNPTSTAYGLGQWTRSSGRQAQFEKVMGRKLQGSTYEQQIAFMQWELTNSERAAGNLIRGSKTEVEALSNYVGGVDWGFMRPGTRGRDVDMRHGQSVLRNNTVNIGTVVVNTQATDAKGVAAGVRQAITQANTGMK
jgi:hypothetical protein